MFTAEQAALVSVVNGLDSVFNVGLMYFTGSGGANDGAAVRFASSGSRRPVLAQVRDAGEPHWNDENHSSLLQPFGFGQTLSHCAGSSDTGPRM